MSPPQAGSAGATLWHWQEARAVASAWSSSHRVLCHSLAAAQEYPAGQVADTPRPRATRPHSLCSARLCPDTGPPRSSPGILGSQPAWQGRRLPSSEVPEEAPPPARSGNEGDARVAAPPGSPPSLLPHGADRGRRRAPGRGGRTWEEHAVLDGASGGTFPLRALLLSSWSVLRQPAATVSLPTAVSGLMGVLSAADREKTITIPILDLILAKNVSPIIPLSGPTGRGRMRGLGPARFSVLSQKTELLGEAVPLTGVCRVASHLPPGSEQHVHPKALESGTQTRMWIHGPRCPEPDAPPARLPGVLCSRCRWPRSWCGGGARVGPPWSPGHRCSGNSGNSTGPGASSVPACLSHGEGGGLLGKT
ncbi:uncharacterized protein [Saccopteryx bilineata]|uniref:uncharacterized protein n=1 Tax=Saccopteryx bilineata TaxID=59482 RepID=UPI00338D3A39